MTRKKLVEILKLSNIVLIYKGSDVVIAEELDVERLRYFINFMEKQGLKS